MLVNKEAVKSKIFFKSSKWPSIRQKCTENDAKDREEAKFLSSVEKKSISYKIS